MFVKGCLYNIHIWYWSFWLLIVYITKIDIDSTIVYYLPTITCAISAYHHWSCAFEPCSWWNVLDTTLWGKVCQWLAPSQLFSPGTPVSSTKMIDRHDVAEILVNIVHATTMWSRSRRPPEKKPSLMPKPAEINNIWRRYTNPVIT
jgi:hypothetical protein